MQQFSYGTVFQRLLNRLRHQNNSKPGWKHICLLCTIIVDFLLQRIGTSRWYALYKNGFIIIIIINMSRGLFLIGSKALNTFGKQCCPKAHTLCITTSKHINKSKSPLLVSPVNNTTQPLWLLRKADFVFHLSSFSHEFMDIFHFSTTLRKHVIELFLN